MRQIRVLPTITKRDSGNLDKYFNDLAKIDVITPEKELELASKIQQGDQQALEKLVLGNLRFVVSVAKHYQDTGVPLNDLINEGNIGLMKAAQRFDATRGFKFISYAVWWIQQSILQYLNRYSRFIRLPANKIAALSKLEKSDIVWEQHHERPATEQELAELTGRSSDEVKQIKDYAYQYSSVDKPFKEGEMGSLLDVMVNTNAEVTDENLSAGESLKIDLQRLLAVLEPKEREILELYFGIDQDLPWSLQDIAEKWGISRERARQLRDKALANISNNPGKDILLHYLAT